MILVLLLGDGSVPTQPDGTNGVFHVPMVNRQFLEWYDHRMGSFTTGVSLKKTAEELAENNRKSGFSRLRKWYESGTKRVPESFELTPKMTNFCHISDRSLDVDRDRTPRAAIRARTESDRSEFLLDMFRSHGFDPNFRRETIRFSRTESPALLDWTGNPPPGFEYKRVLDSRERYDRLKAQAYGEARAL